MDKMKFQNVMCRRKEVKKKNNKKLKYKLKKHIINI